MFEGSSLPSQLHFNTACHLERDDGAPAETLGQLFEAHSDGSLQGEFDRRAELCEPRWLRFEGGRLQLMSVSWHESWRAGTPTVIRQEGRGEPKLVVQQIGTEEEVTSGRLVVDEHLWAWDVDREGNVVERGQLGVADKDPD